MEKTKERVENIETSTRRLEEITDSESETEDECKAVKITEKFQSNAVKRLVKKSLNNDDVP